MKIEYEAAFPNIDKAIIRETLKQCGAKLIKAEFLQKRTVFKLPQNPDDCQKWLRVRDEGDRITLSLKESAGNKISDQKELCLVVDSYADAVKLLQLLGCPEKSYQETKRELWRLDGAEVTIDEWPYLEPFVEIEADSEAEVRNVCEKLNLNYKKAVFGSVDKLYNLRYGTSINIINNETPRITFREENPFTKRTK